MSKKSKKVSKSDKKSKVSKKSKKSKEKKESYVPAPRTDKDGNMTINENELLVLQFAKKHKNGFTLKDLASKFKKKAGKYSKKDASKGTDKAHSWARNSIRRPVRAKLLKQVGRGEYALTKLGRSSL